MKSSMKSSIVENPRHNKDVLQMSPYPKPEKI